MFQIIKMPPQAALAQEGITKQSDYSDDDEAEKKTGTEAGLPRIHIAPRVTRGESFSSYRQKHNPLHRLGISSYLVIIFIEIGSQQGTNLYVVVWEGGARVVEGECCRDATTSPMLERVNSWRVTVSLGSGFSAMVGELGTGMGEVC